MRFEKARLDIHAIVAETSMPMTIKSNNLAKNFEENFSRMVITSGAKLNITRIESQREDSKDGTNGSPLRSIEVDTTLSRISSKSVSALSFFTFSFNLLFTVFTMRINWFIPFF
jgi:hypothetical protein